jgi:trans-feruloyl-CoA hydratase/vanillin synthase
MMTSMPELPGIKVAVDGVVATVRLDRPEKKNAMSPEMHAAMHRALDHIEAAGDVKVVVLTGTGDVFCGGMDLEKYFLEAYETPARFRDNLAVSHAWMRRWLGFPAVTVAAINGWCMGGGLLMANLCDIAITAEEAMFGLSEVNFGIFPSGGTTWSVAQVLSRRHALYYSLTAEPFDGKRAVEIGAAVHAVPRAALDQEVARVVGMLSQKNLEALRYTKRVYERSRTMSFPDAQQYEVAMLHDLSYQTDARWIRQALEQFKQRKYRPGLGSFEEQ